MAAGFWRRGAAFVIDCFLTYVVLFLGAILIAVLRPFREEMSDNELLFRSIVVYSLWVGIPIGSIWIIPIASKGASLGYRCLGIVVVKYRTGSIPSFADAVIRFLGLLLEVATLGLGVIAAFYTPMRRTWADSLAGTVVLNQEAINRGIFTCPACGYDLRGSLGGTYCPECGESCARPWYRLV